LADQPERRATLGLSGGNSTFHARFGYLVDLNELSTCIMACGTCRTRQYDGDRTWDLEHCQRCTQWEMDGDHPLLLNSIPKGYPVEELEGNERLLKKLKPKRITLELLRKRAVKTSHNLIEGRWNIQTAKIYLKTSGINDMWVEHIVKTSLLIRLINAGSEDQLEEYSDDDLELADKVILGEKTIYPCAWDDELEFFQNLDVPMHLLFLGVVKTTVKIIFRWCKKKNKFTDLLRIAKGES